MLRPYTTLTLSMRVPPNVVPERAGAVLKELLEAEPPLVSCADRIISLASGLHSSKSASNIAAEQGMQVTYNLKKAGAGWEAPAVAPWLEIAAENASSKVRLRCTGSMAADGSATIASFSLHTGERPPADGA